MFTKIFSYILFHFYNNSSRLVFFAILLNLLGWLSFMIIFYTGRNSCSCSKRNMTKITQLWGNETVIKIDFFTLFCLYFMLSDYDVIFRESEKAFWGQHFWHKTVLILWLEFLYFEIWRHHFPMQRILKALRL